jgi:hypothetical protein
MFVGHYSVAFAIKAALNRQSHTTQRSVPLWVLFIAVQLVDVFWALFIMMGVEHVRITPGFMAASPLDLYDMPYTHSLPAALLWAGFAAFVYVLVARPLNRSAAAYAVAAAVASHWVLDLIVHTHDLPLWGREYKVGLGLWNSLAASASLELALLLIGLWLYMRSTRVSLHAAGAVSTLSPWAMPAFVALMCAIWIGNHFMSPPPSNTALGVSALLVFGLFAAGAAWAERKRVALSM